MKFSGCLQPILLSVALIAGLGSPVLNAKPGKQPPNILFMVMDDVGIDQMKAALPFRVEGLIG